MSDRTIHATYQGMEIVRYDRSGKWYLEPSSRFLRRQHVTVDEAVDQALWGFDNGGAVFIERPGGGTFDRKFRAAAGDRLPS